MAMIKVFDSEGCKVIKCFDTLVSVPYLLDEEDSASEDTEAEE